MASRGAWVSNAATGRRNPNWATRSAKSARRATASRPPKEAEQELLRLRIGRRIGEPPPEQRELRRCADALFNLRREFSHLVDACNSASAPNPSAAIGGSTLGRRSAASKADGGTLTIARNVSISSSRLAPSCRISRARCSFRGGQRRMGVCGRCYRGQRMREKSRSDLGLRTGAQRRPLGAEGFPERNHYSAVDASGP